MVAYSWGRRGDSGARDLTRSMFHAARASEVLITSGEG